MLLEGAAPLACRCGGSGAPVGGGTGNPIQAADITIPFFTYLPDAEFEVPTTILAGRKFLANSQGPVYVLGQMATVFTTSIELANVIPPGGSFVEDIIDASGVKRGNFVRWSPAGVSGGGDQNKDTQSAAVADANNQIAIFASGLTPPNIIFGTLIRVSVSSTGKYNASLFVVFGLP